MGVVSWLRTGNIIFDMAIAMIIPIVCRYLFEGSGRAALISVHKVIVSWLWRRPNECIRVISFQATQGRHHGPYSDTRNELLQKALALYFTDVAKVVYPAKASVALTAVHDMRTMMHHDRPDKYNPLANLRLTWLAPEGDWVSLDSSQKIDFRQYTNSTSTGDGSNNGNERVKEQTVYELRAGGKNASEKIDALIEKAVEWYKTELRRQRDDARYLYVMSVAEKWSASSTDKEDDDSQKYKRYRLSDNKQFDSLFFRDKEALLTLLDNFQNKRGKYAVSGFPHKLGLLLHGPPGTGKTSLIKALAHATNRSVISIPLGSIKTNQQLMDVMYDLKLKVDGSDNTPRLEFKDVIFVIEDVDAASKIVLRREAQPSMGTIAPEQLTALASSLSSTHAPKEAPGSKIASDGEEGPAIAPRAPTVSEMVDEMLKPRPDALNLAGLLNVLDGVVDTPGRMLILTSNHPEKLDPALIRPGRVDRLIHLGYLRVEEAAHMIAHNFGGELSGTQRSRLVAVLERASQLTPATLEQQCARHETVDALLDGLATQVRETGAATTGSTEVIAKPDDNAIGPPVKASKVAIHDDDDKATTASTPPQIQHVKRQTSGG